MTDSKNGTTESQAMNPARLLCPVDFSEASQHAIEHAVVVAGYYNSLLTALHVLTPLSLAGLWCGDVCGGSE